MNIQEEESLNNKIIDDTYVRSIYNCFPLNLINQEKIRVTYDYSDMFVNEEIEEKKDYSCNNNPIVRNEFFQNSQDVLVIPQFEKYDELPELIDGNGIKK